MLTYREYLRQLNANPQTSAFDYARYLEDQNQVGSFCRLTSSVVFLLDYTTRNYPYMDANSKAVVGHSSNAFKEGGLEYMLHHYYSRDLQLYNKYIFPDRLQFLASCESNCPEAYRFTHTFRLQRSDGKYDHVLQHCNIITSTEDSSPVAVFGAVINITDHMGAGRVTHIIEQSNLDGRWVPLFTKYYYPDIEENELLSKRELEILKWLREGYTSQQIADQLHISYFTVNTHRKNMLQKTNSKNARELINFAMSRGMI